MVTARLNAPIPEKNFELIRDRIGQIITAELANQATLQTDPDIIALLNATRIFAERFKPFNENQLPAIEVFYFNGEFSNKVQTEVDEATTFYIDFVGIEPGTRLKSGDARSSIALNTLVGMVQHILSSPIWMRLGFDDENIIHHTQVTSVQRTQEENTRDTGNIMMYRMIFEVLTHETSFQNEAVLLDRSTTDVKLDETEIGLQYVYQA